MKKLLVIFLFLKLCYSIYHHPITYWVFDGTPQEIKDINFLPKCAIIFVEKTKPIKFNENEIIVRGISIRINFRTLSVDYLIGSNTCKLEFI